MTTELHINLEEAENARADLYAGKVCMHVLEKAYTDVRTMRAATSLVEVGYTVSIVDIEAESVCIKSIENFNGVCVKHITVPDSFIATRFKKWVLIRAARMFIRSTLRLIQTPADIYHALDLPALPACYIAARLRRKPLIFEAYELPLSTLPLSEQSTSRRLLHAIFAPLLAHILPRCAGVITVSPPIVRVMRERYNLPNVTLIRNLPVYRKVQKSDRLRQYLGLKPEVRIALYQGYFQPNRGLDVLVRAAAFLEQDILIVLMGKNRLATQVQLEGLVVREGMADRVKIIPAVPYEELLEWTASADIGLNILPPDYSLSIRWCLPNKLFEYLMAGIPVLTSDLDAVVELIKTYDVGLIVPSLTASDIGSAINAMLSDNTALQRMRQNALEATRNDLNWEKESSQLISLYKDIFAEVEEEKQKGKRAQNMSNSGRK